MKESGNNQSEEKVVHLPPVWCGSICRNSMNEICIEHCAVERDCSAFEPKQNLKLEDMPRFPSKASKNMTREEKFTSVTIYLAKVVDHLKGVDNGQSYPPIPRPNLNRSPGSGLPTGQQIKDILSGVQQEDSAYQNSKEREDQEVRTGKMVEGDD